MNRIIQFLKDNVLLVVPSVAVLIVLFGFLTFGLSRPVTTLVDTTQELTVQQKQFEDLFMTNYNAGDYNESDPFIVLDPFHVSPLSALMIFETDELLQYQVHVKGKESNGDMVYISEPNTLHYLPLYGLYADYINTVEVYEYSDGVVGELVSTTNIETEPLPEEVVVPTDVNTTYEYFGNDIMLLIPALNSYPIGIDYNGDIRFIFTMNVSFTPLELENGRLLIGSDRTILSPYYMTGLYEVDFLGKVYRDYKVPGGYHHDVQELENGNLLVLTNDFEQGTVEDVIVEYERYTGEIVKEIKLLDLLPQLDGMSEAWTASDWFHNNSVSYNEDTDEILLSGRHQDIVVSLDYETTEINYIIGDPDNFGEEFVTDYFLTPIGDDFEWQYAQHDAMFLPNGDVFLFDNGNNKSKFVENYIDAENSYSRGVIYRINQEERTIEQIYQFGKEIGSEFYSPYISNIDYYDEGHYLIHSGGHGEVDGEILNIPGPLYDGVGTVEYYSRTIEIKDGRIMYSLEVDDNFYNARRMSLYNDHTRYLGGPGLLIGELAETEVYEESIRQRFNLFDTVPEIYNISFLKEGDRLEFKGEFQQADLIYLRLVSDTDELLYRVPTSRTDYTAMCTVTFQGDDRFVTYYINETNVSGDYKIYLIINGREYNTYNNVIFD